MCLIYLIANTYFYYKFKAIRRESKDRKTTALNQLIRISKQKGDFIVNPRNLTRILFLNVLALVGLLDTEYDLVFLALCYASGVIWLAIVVGLCYIYTFFDKVHSVRKLFGLTRDLYNKRYEKNILLSASKEM
jgi:hypothetical protein